jgi:hypothetical protein
MQCKIELIVPCCFERPVYYALCRTCLREIEYPKLKCLGCTASIEGLIYQLQSKVLALPLQKSLSHIVPSKP